MLQKPFLLILALAEDGQAYRAGYETGYLIGQMVPIILVSAAALKCHSISRRPTTNAKSCLALMFVFIGWVAAMLPQIVRTLGGADAAYRFAMGIGALVLFVSLLLALVLGIIGLVELRSHPGRWVQGRHQATWALVLSGILLGIAAISAFYELRNPVPRALRVPDADTPGVVHNEDLNFTYQMPGLPWVQIDAKKFNAESSLAIARARPQIFYMIIAEDTGSQGIVADNDILAEMVRVNLAAAASSIDIVETRPQSFNGLDGLRIYARATVQGKPLAYAYWICAHNGFAYQCVTGGELSVEADVRREAEQLNRNFRVTDMNRSTLPPAPGLPDLTDPPRRT